VSGPPLDEDLLARVQEGAVPQSRVWEPNAVAVVLGRSNRAEREADVAACTRDGVPVLRRRGGGGAVLLAPGCLVASLALAVERPLAVGAHLEGAADLLARAVLEASGVALERRGSGDLCVGDRKVAGSSAFCGRGVFFYQASLLVDLDLDLVGRYLPHPSREPAYRGGRVHGDFLTTLLRAGFRGPIGTLARDLEASLAAALGRAGIAPG
jgi:lipoate---protein ligase